MKSYAITLLFAAMLLTGSIDSTSLQHETPAANSSVAANAVTHEFALPATPFTVTVNEDCTCRPGEGDIC